MTSESSTTHLLWIIAVLLGLLILVTQQVPDGNVIRDYLSFASSVASLVLAVVAIFYAMISNQSFAQTVGNLQAALNQSQENASRIGIAADELQNKSLELIDEISKFRPEITNNFEKLDAKISQIQGGKSKDDADGSIITSSSSDLVSGSMSAGVLIALYMIFKSSESRISINLSNIFDEKPVAKRYISGVFATISALQPIGIKLVASKDPVGEFTVVSTGDANLGKVVTRVNRSKNEFTKEYKEKIDEYFSSVEAGGAG